MKLHLINVLLCILFITVHDEMKIMKDIVFLLEKSPLKIDSVESHLLKKLNNKLLNQSTLRH